MNMKAGQLSLIDDSGTLINFSIQFIFVLCWDYTIWRKVWLRESRCKSSLFFEQFSLQSGDFCYQNWFSNWERSPENVSQIAEHWKKLTTPQLACNIHKNQMKASKPYSKCYNSKLDRLFIYLLYNWPFARQAKTKSCLRFEWGILY